MDKIELEICTGTTCYLLGASDLLDVLENLPGPLKEKVSLRGVACQDFCKSGAKPPFIKINGIVMGEMSSERLIATLENTLGDENLC